MQIAALLNHKREKFRHMPWALVGTVGALTMIGVLFIYSASNDFTAIEEGGRTSGYATKQIAYLALGALGALFIGTIDYRQFIDHFYWAYIVGIGLLVGCMIFGTEINGAKSWIKFPGFSLQVSEFCKLCYVITLAGMLRSRDNAKSPAVMGAILLLTAVMLGFILLQPDFGTAMVFIPVFFASMWVCGARLKLLLPMLLSGAAMLPTAYFSGLFKDHQMRRIDTWIASVFGGDMDLTGDGYHISMSMNAIGSGGFSGKGLFNGTLSQYDYLPERHTDFIFAVIGEETGFVGCAIVVGLYLMLVVLCLLTALRTREMFGRIMCVGFATMFFAQFLINAGMTCGLMPVTGIPLFFVSYGGSSLMAAMIAVGMVMSVRMHPK